MITLRGNPELRLRRVVALLDRRAARVLRDAARLVGVLRMARDVPVGRPLPDVAGHVEEAEAVRREGADRRPGAVAGLRPPGELAVPVVRTSLAARFRLVAPDEVAAVEPAARGQLPLGLARQLLPGPGRVRLGVLVGDVHHGLVLAALRRARRAVGMPPAGAGRPGPPLAQMPEVDRPLRPREDERAGHEVLGRSARERARIERALGDGDVARLVDEGREQAVRDLERVDPEALDADAVRRRLLRIVRVGAHPVRRPVDPDHVLRRSGHAKTVDQSFLMLTTVQPSACARSSEASAPAV